MWGPQGVDGLPSRHVGVLCLLLFPGHRLVSLKQVGSFLPSEDTMVFHSASSLQQTQQFP